MERRAARWQAAALAAAMTAAAHGVEAQGIQAALAEGAVFSADVTVERAVVDGRGRVTRQLPRSRYRIEQFAGGRGRMAMLASTTQPGSGPLADPYAGMSVEFDPAGAGLRIIGKDGQPVPGASPLPTGLTPPELASGAGDGIVAPANDAPKRRAELTRQFGARAGTVRQLERYLTRQGTRVQEVLVSPATALPVEVNVVADGVLDEHHAFGYEEHAGGQIVRVRTRSESRVPGAAGERLVSITSLSNVRLAGGVE